MEIAQKEKVQKMRDWNHDGKIDKKDQMMDYHIFEETCKNDSSYYVRNSGSGGGVFKGTAIVIIVLIVLALVLGVGVPGEVLGFFATVLLVVGWFTLLGKLFK